MNCHCLLRPNPHAGVRSNLPTEEPGVTQRVVYSWTVRLQVRAGCTWLACLLVLEHWGLGSSEQSACRHALIEAYGSACLASGLASVAASGQAAPCYAIMRCCACHCLIAGRGGRA